MALVSRMDIERYTGFSYKEFTDNGVEMTEGQWVDFIQSMIPKVTQMLHRYCNVHSFERVQVTEYHNGKGATNYDSSVSDWNEEDVTFFLKNLFCDTLQVYEDTSSKTTAPHWVLRTERTTGVAGDYETVTDNEATRIFFHRNIPVLGRQNIKFVYYTGYLSTSAQLSDIQFQCLRAIKNVLLQKKKVQEASSIRAYGVRDYSQMFDVFSEGIVINDKIKAALDQYRRAIIPGVFAYD